MLCYLPKSDKIYFKSLDDCLFFSKKKIKKQDPPVSEPDEVHKYHYYTDNTVLYSSLYCYGCEHLIIDLNNFKVYVDSNFSVSKNYLVACNASYYSVLSVLYIKNIIDFILKISKLHFKGISKRIFNRIEIPLLTSVIQETFKELCAVKTVEKIAYKIYIESKIEFSLMRISEEKKNIAINEKLLVELKF
jgi:hypothetical protein